MTCYHPLKGWVIGTNPKTGNRKIKVTSSDVDYVGLRDRSSSWESFNFSSNSALKFNYRNSFFHYVDESIDIPCGHCIGCRLKYSRDWAVRCMLESQQYDRNSFITLTYDNEHLPPCREYIDSDGVINISPVHSLRRSDVQKFLKRLRARFPDITIRYYGCGEYGPENMRPHYHLILFNFYPDDIYVFKRNRFNQPIFRSPILEELWPFGFVGIGSLTFESAAYVARYITKKQYGETSAIYDEFNYDKEFSMMSLKPGIAFDYYSDNREHIYEFDEIHISRGLDKAISSKPPRYFDKLYDIDYPEKSSELKAKRQAIAELNKENVVNYTGLKYEEVLANREKNKLASIKSLKRTL